MKGLRTQKRQPIRIIRHPCHLLQVRQLGPDRYSTFHSLGISNSRFLLPSSPREESPEFLRVNGPIIGNPYFGILLRILPLRLRRWRDFGIARGGLHQIVIERSCGSADRPANSAAEKVQEKRTQPVLRTVANRGIKDPASAVHSRPGHRVRRALERLSRHLFGIECQDNVKVRLEILQRIPLVVEVDRRRYSLKPGESRVIDNEVRRLQARRAAMSYELTAQHAQIRVGLFSVGDVAVRDVLRIGLSMEGIACRVDADKSQALVNSIEQGLLALRRHCRVLVSSYRGQISGGEEEHCGMLPEILGIKNPAVFARRHVEAMLFPKGAYGLLNDAGLAASRLHYIVFKAGRLRENEH